MNIADLRKKSDKELREQLAEGQDKVREMRFKLASRQLKDMRVLRKTKREIAQILTILDEKSAISEKTN